MMLAGSGMTVARRVPCTSTSVTRVVPVTIIAWPVFSRCTEPYRVLAARYQVFSCVVNSVAIVIDVQIARDSPEFVRRLKRRTNRLLMSFVAKKLGVVGGVAPTDDVPVQLFSPFTEALNVPDFTRIFSPYLLTPPGSQS